MWVLRVDSGQQGEGLGNIGISGDFICRIHPIMLLFLKLTSTVSLFLPCSSNCAQSARPAITLVFVLLVLSHAGPAVSILD